MRRRWSVGLLCALTAAMCTSAAPVSAGWLPRSLFVGFALAAAALLWSLSTREPARAVPLRARHVLLVAVALRVLALPLHPVLSDDGYRYLWDGRRTVDGLSPYAERPRDLDATDLALFARLNSPDVYSVYPPLPQAVFALSTWLAGGDLRWSWLLLKVLTTGAELVGVAALLRVAAPSRVMLYAWSPLAVVEIAGQGHTEGLFVGALGILVWAVERRPRWAAVPAAVAAAVKLWPVALLLPAVRRSSRWGAVAALVLVALGLGPLVAPTTAAHVGESLALYAGHFDWYAPAYRALKSAVWPLLGADSGLTVARGMALAWAALVAALALTDDGSRGGGRRAVAGMVAGYVLLSPVLHPWHLLPLLAVIPLLQHAKSGYVLASMSVATYLVYVTEPAVGLLLSALGWGSAAVALLASGGVFRQLMRRRARDKWRRLAPAFAALSPGARLLDLGCGEGEVGHAAAESTGAAVTLADIVDFHGDARPLVALSGKTLPFGNLVFQGTLLSYVLHHATDPRHLIAEALRVTAGPVVALESVVRWKASNPLLQTLDHFVNNLRSDGRMIEQRPAWRSVAEWQALARQEGWTLATTGTRGWLHPTAVLVFSASASTETVSALSHSADSRRRSHVH